MPSDQSAFRITSRLDRWYAGAFALLLALLVTYGLTPRPDFTDAYYHYNIAERVAQGDGFVTDHFWSYVGQPPVTDPPRIEGPSHTYWMPLTTLVSGLSMMLLNQPQSFAAAQLPHALAMAGALYLTYVLGLRFGQARRHGIIAMLMLAAGGYYVNFWGSTDTFALYALIGSWALYLLGRGLQRPAAWTFAAVGVLAGLGHLTRSDGLLLLLTGYAALGWAWLLCPADRLRFGQVLRFAVLMTLPYLLVMLPWALRMLDVVGAPLPVGGLSTAFMTNYDQLFAYPFDMGPQDLFAEGIGAFLETRWIGLSTSVQGFIGVQGYIVLTPLMLIGLWVKRGAFTAPLMLFALGLHAAMILIFPLPGFRGTLLHAAIALMPWWTALSVVGLDSSIDWIARRRRHWRPRTAKRVFSVGLVATVCLLSAIIWKGPYALKTPDFYAEVDALLPADARIMTTDPAELAFWIGRGGAATPNNDMMRIRDVARDYGLDYFLVSGIVYDPDDPTRVRLVQIPTAMRPFDPDDVPDFLTPIPLESRGALLYAIDTR